MMQTKLTPSRLLRYLLYMAAILLALAFISTRLSVFPLYDFIQYWSGAYLNLTHGNPYSPNDMLRIQATAGWDVNILPNMIFMPPTILGLVLPIGLLPYSYSRLLWFIASLFIIVAFAEQGWQIYGGERRFRWIAWILLLAFGPTLQTINRGQIVPLQMLGLLGFLLFIQKERFFLAGLATSLMLLKPHTVYLFWIALLLWSLPRKPAEFMTSQVVSYMIIALVQAALLFAMMYVMGFRPAVGLSTYAFAFILVLLFSLSNVGFGLITATLAKTSGAATGIAFLFLLPQLFLGTFVGASLSSGAQIAGKFVPSYYVTDALTSLFLRGAAITSPTVLLDTAAVSVSCIAILAIGVVLYGKYFKI